MFSFYDFKLNNLNLLLLNLNNKNNELLRKYNLITKIIFIY